MSDHQHSDNLNSPDGPPPAPATYNSVLADLRDQVQRHQALFVIGAGVSIAASGGAATASWKGLLTDGLRYIRELGRCSAETAQRIQAQIESQDLTELLSAATYVAQRFGAPRDGEFRRWLRESVGQLAPTHPDIIEAIAATECALFTTNYDFLVEKVTGRSPLTWENLDRGERLLRGEENPIFHLHGHWEAPESVILGQDDYALITSNPAVQTFLRAAHLQRTFVYVGCGDGLDDPNFSRFFEWSERFFPESQTRRYRFALRSEVATLQHKHPAGHRVQVLAYGERHSDLAPFLRGLMSAKKTSKHPRLQPNRKLLPNKPPDPRFELRGIDWYEESDARYLHGRRNDVERVKQLLVEHPVVRLPGPSGVGKSSLLRAGLVPALRRLGWRVAVIRLYEDPARNIPGELTLTLLDDTSEPFAFPLDAYALRRQIAPLLDAEGCPALALLIDQTEDVLAPSAAVGARAWLRDFLREVHRCRETMPLLKVVLGYRTEAEAQLGPVWQQASGEAAGFPYHTLRGITPEDAEAIIEEVAERLGWKLEVAIRELVNQLRAESRSVLHETYIFPPYLQILLSTVAASADQTVNSAFLHQLGGVQAIVAAYLRRQANELEQRGGDYERVRSVLQAVCRSTGEKLRQTTAEIAEYCCLSETTTRSLLIELVKRRLVRPLGGDSFEIQHDRLAEVIIAELDPQEKEFKIAAELLVSKAASFRSTKALLTRGELEMLFAHREKLPARGSSERLLIASMLHACHSATLPPVGWIWLRDKSVREVIETVQESGYPLRAPIRRAISATLASHTSQSLDFLIHVAEADICKLRKGALEAIEAWSNTADTDTLRRLLHHGNAKIRRAAALSPAHRDEVKSRNILRELAIQDEDLAVRQAAVEALADLKTAADVAVFREVAAEGRGQLAKRATELLGARSAKAGAALGFLLRAARSSTAKETAARSLLQRPDKTSQVVKTILESGDWKLRVTLAEESDSLPMLQRLAQDRTASVRIASIRSIAC